MGFLGLLKDDQMANEEQVEILNQGVEVWNKWRANNLSVRINLRGARLNGAKLNGVDFRMAGLSQAELRKASLVESNLRSAILIQSHLREADIRYANLYGTHLDAANLFGADLTGTILIKANLKEADLAVARLTKANLSRANLLGADFRGAELSETDFNRANLNRANFIGAILSNTIFAFTDLSQIIGIEKVHHLSPSSVGVEAIYKGKGRIPETFLRGCGLSDADIEYAKLSNPDLSNEEINKILYKIYDLRATQALQISPLFISYSHGDSSFVDKIETHLNNKGVRFWRDVHDMKSGRIETQVDRAIHQNPTVLLILSENSLKSDWVEHEVRTARELEKEMGQDVLCPVALDHSWKNSLWPKRVMEQVMEYNILDFSAWKDDSRFGSIFNRLIDGLGLFYKG